MRTGRSQGYNVSVGKLGNWSMLTQLDRGHYSLALCSVFYGEICYARKDSCCRR